MSRDGDDERSQTPYSISYWRNRSDWITQRVFTLIITLIGGAIATEYHETILLFISWSGNFITGVISGFISLQLQNQLLMLLILAFVLNSRIQYAKMESTKQTMDGVNEAIDELEDKIREP